MCPLQAPTLEPAPAGEQRAPAGERPAPAGERSAPAGEPPAGELPWPRAFASARTLTRPELLDAPVRWPRPSRLQAPLEVASSRVEEGLRTLGLTSVGALLEHLPRDSRDARTISQLARAENATVAVEVREISVRPLRRRGMKPLVEAIVFDETGTMCARFFNQPWLAQRYRPGTRLVLHGKLAGRGAFNVAYHAVGSDIGTTRDADGGEVARVAHYPATDGLSSTQILTLVRDARQRLADIPETLAASVRVDEKLPDRAAALAAMHFPRSSRDLERARRRLAFEELLLSQLAFLRRSALRRARRGAPVLARAPELSARWLDHELPFALTGDQGRAITEIRDDLAQDCAMQRLLLGEVGSGKTVVATYALLRAVEHGQQAALMAPTETLAEQHFATLQRLLGCAQAEVTCALLTGSTAARTRRQTLGRLRTGELQLIVGTHAVIEPDVRFRALAVAVVDEQHRFGVRQRAALDDKASSPAGPHVLHMTATPIPRTLALAQYGDLDTSILRELPQGRQPIETRIVAGDDARARAYARVRQQLRQGRQAYVVCPQIEQTEDSADAGAGSTGAAAARDETRAAVAELERLRSGELRDHRLVLLHGAMRPREKAKAMAEFASGAGDVLVATTVIEVGIDVPNATVMLIENAERFGISQLHQLRGRIGRGQHRSLCLLMGPPGAPRLRALREHADGFALSEIDLRLRKEGELIGTRQSGVGQFKIACLPDDEPLLERARAQAQAIMRHDPELQAPEHALLGDRLELELGAAATERIPG
jgi:ATP-dependent DNA helicase RecG